MSQANWSDRIPLDGLRTVLSSWSGKGLLSALGALPAGPDVSTDWSPKDVRRRAARVLIQRLATLPVGSPLIGRLPKRGRDWQDAIPAAIHADHWQADTVRPGVSWSKTIAKYGWPPKAFVGRSRRRTHDMRIISPASWTAHRVLGLLADAVKVCPEVEETVAREAAALRDFVDLLETPEMPVNAPHPRREDLAHLKSEGKPWSALASIASEIIRVESDPLACAFDLICPDEQLSWRLYHLGVMGLVLIVLKGLGAEVSSLRPIGDWGAGPAYDVHYDGRHLDLWFESAGVWSREKLISPYMEATAGVRSTSPLGADILLHERGSSALAIECKFYKGLGEGAARDGFHQAATYSAELRARLCANVWSCVVMPDDQVESSGWTELPSGRVGVTPHGELAKNIGEFLGV